MGPLRGDLGEIVGVAASDDGKAAIDALLDDLVVGKGSWAWGPGLGRATVDLPLADWRALARLRAVEAAAREAVARRYADDAPQIADYDACFAWEEPSMSRLADLLGLG